VDKLGLTKQYPPGNGKFYFDDYNQLFALAKALQVEKGGKVVKWGLSGEGWDLPTLGGQMLTMGVTPFDGTKEQFNFNTPAGIQAMKYHVEIPVSLGIEREWNVGDAVISQALNGNVAVTMANGDVAIEGNDLYGLHYVITGMPKIDGKIPQSFGEGQGWGIVGPIKPQHPNLQIAFLRMMATAAGQYQYDLTYGGVDVVAWKDFLLHDTSRFHPANKTNNEWVVSVTDAQWLQSTLLNCHYIGRAGYTDRIDAAVFTGCQAVREKKMTAEQAMAHIQDVCTAQYKQYKIDLANLQ
jgi:hypothetical protein